MIVRDIQSKLLSLAQSFPCVTVTGPRQSGKSTLCRAAFASKPYVSLERPDVRAFAEGDPLGFLDRYRKGAVIDEAQRVPELFSYLQVEIDERPEPGRFVLSGSQHFGLLRTVTQSLAGRTAVLHLLPCTWAEVQRFGPDAIATDLWPVVWTGGYPAIYDRRISPPDWHAAYVASYLERDVRELLAVQDMRAFRTFLRLAAGRTGQLLNVASLAADAGIAHATAQAWLGVLETSFILYRLPAWHRNRNKRLVKAPKLHFLDTGLCCRLLDIHDPGQLSVHPLRGALFETWVATEILKQRFARGSTPNLFHYRDRKGHEVDLVLEDGPRILAVEVKSGQTAVPDFFAPLSRFAREAPAASSLATTSEVQSTLVYGGGEERRQQGVRVLPWSHIDTLDSTPRT